MEEEIPLRIRTIDGSSAVVRIAPDRTVGELQKIIKQSFPPAKEFPNFRLFYKGAQLNTESSLRRYLIDDGDFLVLIPFVKRTRDLQQPEIQSENSKQFESWTQADSTWKDMMEDLKSLSDAPNAPPSDSFKPTKSNRTEFCLLFLRNFLRNSKSVLDSLPKCQGSSPDSGLADCLSDPDRGSCYYSYEFCRDSGNFGLCTCPVWLKRLVKCFSFLNAAHSFLIMQHRGIEWQCLRQALERPGVHQVDEFSVSDVELLMFLFPMLVMRGNQKTFLSNSSEAVVLLDYTEDLIVQSKLKNSDKTHSSRQRREDAFKEALISMIRSAAGRITSGSTTPSSPSLDDIISFRETCNISEGLISKVVKNKSPVSQNNPEYFCLATTSLQPLEMVDHLKQGLGIRGQIEHIEEFRAKTAVYTELPRELSENTKAVLGKMGISRLYSHQADAICASLSGKNVVVATSTSSGKSLCYNIAVLEELCQNPLSCALYIFPTKALAQDQLRALVEMTGVLCETIDIGVYDGDTPRCDRAFIQNNSRLLITNPDMLHVSILPFHGQFKRILSNLRFIVIDEAHAYKGAFGCHTSLVIRRLCRICSHGYGSNPSFIFCTATSANPREHVMELANLEDVDLIANDGSPCGPKVFLLWNPPLCNTYANPKSHHDQGSTNRGYKEKYNKNEMAGRRTSPIYEVSRLLAEMVQHGLRCIAFCKSRKLCELILCYTRDILGKIASNLVNAITVYRAGYMAKDRRCIESDLFGGKLCGIVATNALELGIDVGHIDATLHLGFPGSFASFWQQAGRSGRRLQPSLSIYVAFDSPIDQYFMKLPKKLFENPIEHCHVDASNSQVIEQHISCAAFEHPLCVKFDEKYFGNCLQNSILTLQRKGYLMYSSSCDIWSYMGPQNQPSLAMGIRAIETEKYAVVDIASNKILEEIEESKAFFTIYDGGVYINQGTTYLVKTLDISKKAAFCQKADVEYYTKTRDYTIVHVFGCNLAYPPPISEIKESMSMPQCQQCRVRTEWFGFYRIRRGTNQAFDTVDLSLPPYSYESIAVWIQISQPIKTLVEARGLSFRAGQHAASHALLNLAPLYIMCNASDLSTECANPHRKRDIPDRLLLYDSHPGGIGLSARLRPLFMELLKDSLRLITSCRCSVGCPDCVQNVLCREYNEVLDKEAAIIILEGLLAERE